MAKVKIDQIAKNFFKSYGIIIAIIFGLGVFVNSMWEEMVYFAEPGYMYHVTPKILGDETAQAGDTSYHWKGFGKATPWKNAMTVQATETAAADSSSATILPEDVIFLDQVGADAEASVRFAIPQDPTMFLKVAHEYRTPGNLLLTALIPTFTETLQSTASLMSAEDYYGGGRSEFNATFENQIRNGSFLVKREEITVETTQSKSSSNASEESTEKGSKTIFVVKKIMDETGIAKRKQQMIKQFGINVTSAIVTKVEPNNKFKARMALKQQASADRAIAREQRVQEEEQRLLAIARGEREVAERQAKAKVNQIEKTTNAETTKQLALTKANQQKEERAIAEETAATDLRIAKIDAEAKQVAADAEAYTKREILSADNALAQKLDAEVRIQTVWAEAFAKRKVATTVIGGSEGGSDGDASNFMQLMTIQAAKQLNYDRQINTK